MSDDCPVDLDDSDVEAISAEVLAPASEINGAYTEAAPLKHFSTMGHSTSHN